VGVYLIIQGLNKKLTNFIYAGTGFLLIALAQLLEVVINLSLIIDRFITGIFIILVVVFTNKTFHKDQKSIVFRQDRLSYLPFIILFISIFNMFIAMYLSYLKEMENSPLIHFIRTLYDFIAYGIAFFWLGGSSYYAFKELKDQYIEPWIKTRYINISIISIIIPILPFLLFFQPWNVRFGDFNNFGSFIIFGISAVLSMVLSIVFLISWVTPNRLKQILNKNYERIIDKNFSEDELTDIIKYLAEKLAEKIELTPIAARGLIKLSIQEHFNKYIPYSQINFKKFKEIVKGTLKERLIKLQIPNVDEIIDNILDHLIKSQSLITMGNL